MKKNWMAALLSMGTTWIVLITASLAFAQTGAAQNTAGDAPTAKGAQGQQTIAPAPLEPESSRTPHTEMLDTSKGGEHDPLLEPKPLPQASLSLIGGIVRKIDAVHNRVTLQPFGSGERYLIYFDERTRILNGGQETTVLAMHPGDRIYVDTQALGAQVFAKTIQVRTERGPAHASGQIIEVMGGQVRLQDRLSGDVVRFALSDRTKVESREGTASASMLHSGSLVDVTFTTGRRNEAQSIMIHATPGESYIFAGILTHVNVADGVLALDNQVDGNNYELYFDPLAEKNVASLVTGTSVRVTANFDGKRYRATSIRVMDSAPEQSSR